MNSFYRSTDSFNNIDAVFVAGETISIGNTVYVGLAGSPTQTEGLIYNCDNSVAEKSSTSWYIGIALNSATSNQGVKVRIKGIVRVFGSLTVGNVYYVGTSGGITDIIPTNALQVGIAINNSELLLTTVVDRNLSRIFYNNQGFFAGGETSGATNIISSINYSTDTTSLTSMTLSQARYSLAGVSDVSGSKGYIAGGTTITNEVATTEKIFYSTSTVAAQTSANLSQARTGLCSLSDNSNSKGYFLGGTTAALAVLVTTADRITYSTNITNAQTSANLSQARTGSGSVSNNSGGQGYVAGGYTGANIRVATADRITYSTNTRVTQTSANLTQARSQLTGISNYSNGKGYFSGGMSGSTVSTGVTLTDKVTYSTHITTSQTSANLSQGRGFLSGVSNDGGGTGYYAGGLTGSSIKVTTAEKATYNVDSVSAQSSANLTVANQIMSSVSTNSV